MHKKLSAALCLSVLLAMASSAPAMAAKKNAPEIDKYFKDLKQQRQEEAKKETDKIKADKFRRLRPYQTLEEVYAELDKVIADHPDLFSGGTYGKSVGGHDLRYVKLSTGPGDKPEILVTGNIHAQELAGGQMVMALIEYFADNYKQSCDAAKLAKSADIYFIPVVNPDNMEKAAVMQARWGVTGFIRKNENGVDLNRNFPYPPDAPDKLKDSAGSPKKRSETHRGPEPLSEPEARSLIGFIDRHHFFLALNYHTSGGLILYEPGTYPDPEPDTDLMREIGLAYQARQFDKYQVEPGINLYPTIGALDDYLYHHYGILSFTVEVGKSNEDHMLSPKNGTISPIFWMYNVRDLDREKANNVPGALAMIGKALEVYNEPDSVKWEPPTELWVGEPPVESGTSGTGMD